ncbi:MAG TPA: HAMP domain-containing sensor histidine kinase [Rhizomicrobium sp.]|nr:HAMP domain-containing sensor histidine kinase [Rhizomicrobium sp.]
MFRSVTSRLVFFYCLLLVALGGAFLLFTALSFQHYTRETVTAALAARTQEIWNTSQGLLQRPDQLANTIERRFAPESQDRFIRIRAGDQMIYMSGNPVERDFSAYGVPLQFHAEEGAANLLGNLLIYSRNFRQPDGSLITIDSGQSYRFARTVQRQLITSLSIGLPLLLILAALAGYVLMRRALTPVEVMINAAEAYSFNNPHSRLPLVGTEPRIEALGLALNRMLDRLDGAYSHVSRFSADAAHELRTPLTIIRGELELILAEARTSTDLDRAVSNALEEMTRLSGIVDSLITLSRMDSLWGKRAHSSVDLLALAIETIDQINLLAVEKQISLERPTGSPVAVAGDRDRLKQVLVNLVDNAIKYTPAGGQVRVWIGVEADNAVLIVADTGIGIVADHQDKVFDRFYRVSPDRGESGAGLGLAIVKSIVHAHGGTVTLDSKPGLGSVFRVELPLPPANLAGSANAPENMVAAAGAAAATGLHGSVL